MDMSAFIDRAGLSFTWEPADDGQGRPPEDLDLFSCALRGRTHEISFHLSAPRGADPPSAEDAIRYLGTAAVEYEACDDLDDWAEENDLDPGDADTRDAWSDMGRLTRELWQLVGQELYGELCREIEIEQAVDMTLAGVVRPGGG